MNGSGKTSLLNVLLQKNLGEKAEGKTQVCLISAAARYMPARPSVETFEQYSTELAKVIRERNGGNHWPNPAELPKLLLSHDDYVKQAQKLNRYLEYLGLPKCETQGTLDTFSVQLQTMFSGSGLQSILAILAALTDDYIKMVLIDEPETYLHPELQKKLRELFYEASKEKQIILATHSNVFINKKNYTSNYFVHRDNNQCSIVQASSEAQLEGVSSAEIRLIKALIKAVPSISLNLPTSLSIEELFVGKPEGPNQTTSTVIEKREEINITLFYEELKASIKDNKDKIAARYRERVQQTNIAYWVSLACLVLGVLFVFVGAILIFIGKLEGGVLTTVSSVISSIVSCLARLCPIEAKIACSPTW